MLALRVKSNGSHNSVSQVPTLKKYSKQQLQVDQQMRWRGDHPKNPKMRASKIFPAGNREVGLWTGKLPRSLNFRDIKMHKIDVMRSLANIFVAFEPLLIFRPLILMRLSLFRSASEAHSVRKLVVKMRRKRRMNAFLRDNFKMHPPLSLAQIAGR